MADEFHTRTETEPAVDTPIVAPASANVQAVMNLVRQIVAFLALLIGVLGLSEASIISKIYRIASRDQTLSLIASVVGAGFMAWSAWKAWRRAVQVQTLAALPMVPDRVARLSAPITPAVQAAVDVAMQGQPKPPVGGHDYAALGETLV